MRFSGRSIAGAILAVVLLPAVAAAQPVARSFADLQSLLEVGDYVVVIDRAERELWGRVADMSARGLTVVRLLRTDGRIETTSERRVFGPDDVGVLFRSDMSGERGAALYPPSWAGVHALPPGAQVTVVFASGERRRYRTAATAGDSLRFLTPSGEHETVRKSDVLRIERRGVNDSVADGIVIGALTGAGIGAGLMALAYSMCDAGCDAPARGPMFLSAMSMSAGVGAGIGWLADRIHKGKEVVFPIVAPVVSRDRKGVAVTLRF